MSKMSEPTQPTEDAPANVGQSLATVIGPNAPETPGFQHRMVPRGGN